MTEASLRVGQPGQNGAPSARSVVDNGCGVWFNIYMTKRLYSLMDPDGWIHFHWRTTHADAVKYAERYAQSGDLLVGPRGETLVRF